MNGIIEVLAPLVFLAGFAGFAFVRSRRIRARHLAALAAYEKERQEYEARCAASMAPYREYHERALAAEDPAMILDAALKLSKAERLWVPLSSAATADLLYRQCLPLLRGRPELRPQVLELGRFAHGWQRPGGALTIYDEQAIQNDMIAHG